jgi:hypothetical protein
MSATLVQRPLLFVNCEFSSARINNIFSADQHDQSKGSEKVAGVQISKTKNSSYANNNRVVIPTTTSTSNCVKNNDSGCVLTVFQHCNNIS